MKKRWVFMLAVAAVLAAGCEDMLDEQVYGKPTIDEMLSNEENVSKVVGQA